MDGKVPSGSPFEFHSPFAQPGNCVPGAIHPFGLPNLTVATPCPFGSAPPPWACAPAPPPYCPGPPVPPIPTPIATPWKPPRPPPPASHSFGGTNEEAEQPLAGNRIKGQLPTFPDKSTGYLFPKENVTLHLFAQNVISKYASNNNVITITDDKFNVQHAPCNMTFEELIDRIDCRSRANYHPPYNQPGQGYPEHLIGIQELLELGGGQFMLGSKIMLTDPRVKSRIGEIWPDTAGSAGQHKPRYIVRLPV